MSKWKTSLVLLSLAGLAAGCFYLIQVPSLAGHKAASGPRMSRMSVPQLVEWLTSAEGGRRVAATRELFRRGPEIAPQLAKAGAKPVATITPTRLDVIYSLMIGLHDANFRSDSLGLELAPGTDRQALALMGKRHGFTPPPGPVDPRRSPTVYVTLRPGHSLTQVMKEVLSTEDRVVTVSLNYVEA